MCFFHIHINHCIFPFKTLAQLKRRIRSSLRAAIRVSFNTVRYAEIYNQHNHEAGENLEEIGHISLLDIGGQATLSGSGAIYDKFQQTGLLQHFSGFGQKALTFFEKGYDKAPLRKMNLDETYYGMNYDVRDSKKSKY